ncbi:GNAT family N-acetyltransferase [Halobellus rubicundus]|uniref:GNAT family N-acetyltransferase n=1 Tax=Halobellus rubicundus TaxID=2996466 RepID=A0ABD5MA46_9EURY
MAATVREATGDDADDIERLLDAAMLDFSRERLRQRIERGSALVAVVGDGADDERVVGGCVFDDPARAPASVGDADAPVTEIEHVAVHRSRRGRGIGRALVAAVDERATGPLIARFRESVRPFYESLGFEIREDGADMSEKRLLGVRV